MLTETKFFTILALSGVCVCICLMPGLFCYKPGIGKTYQWADLHNWTWLKHSGLVFQTTYNCIIQISHIEQLIDQTMEMSFLISCKPFLW